MTEDAKFKSRGSLIDAALCDFLMMNEILVFTKKKIIQESLLHQIPLDPFRLKVTSVIKHPTELDTIRVFIKGAPENILS